MYLSYSGYKRAEGCEYSYWHTYIGKTPCDAGDVLGSIYGSAVGLLFEEFYSKSLWRVPNVREHLEAQVERIVDHCLTESQKPDPKKSTLGGVVRWKGEGPDQNPRGLYASRDELISDVKAAVPRGLTTIRVNRLLGRGASAELKLDAKIRGHILGGRADFVMRRVPPYDDIVILDGKGSRKRDRYVEQTQLVWYSMLYAEHHKRLPDRTAFVYWHFDPPSNIDWCSVSVEDTDALKTKVLKMIDLLTRKQEQVGATMDLAKVRTAFRPRANAQNCRFCPYATESVCEPGFRIVTELKKKDATTKWPR